MKVNPDAIPGTLHLVDEEGIFQAKHDESRKDIVLNPTPSDNPDDPLNWSPRRKYLSMFCVVVYCFGTCIPTAAIYSVFAPISERTGLGLSTLNEGTGYMFLFLGLGCFFWQPVALQYGKRPVYLFTMLATCLVLLWAPHTSGNGAWIGGKILQGFFGAPLESLLEVTISDVWFEHERGSWMSLYAVSLLTASFLAPTIAGFISDGQGWEWVMYWCSIFAAVCFIFLFFFMEETNFSRKNIAADDVLHVSGEQDSINSATNPPEKSTGIVTRVGDAESSTGSIDMANAQTKTFFQKLKMFDTHKPSDQLWINFWRPVTMFRFPSILFAGFCYGTSLVWFNVLNGTASLIFTEYYNFTPAQVGLTYLSPTIASVIICIYSAWACKYLKIKLAKRAGGVSEAEHRLWVILLYVIICPAGLLVWGVGSVNGVHWIGPVIAMGMIGGGGALGCSVACNYAVDSYRELSGASMVGVIVIRNLISFAVSYGITPWIVNTGIKNTFIAACCISTVCIMSFLVMVFYGKALRNKTKKAYWEYVQIALDKGMTH